MTATRTQYDRYLEPPDAEIVDCPACRGDGSVIHGAVAIPCPLCEGMGVVEADPEDLAEAHAEMRYDAMLDREAER